MLVRQETVTWSDIDFKNGRIRLESRHKGRAPKRKVYYVPLVKALRAELNDCGLENQEYFLGYKSRNWLRDFHRDLKKAKLPMCRLKDLRHSLATYLINQGVDLSTIQRQLDHSSITMTEKYSHLNPDFAKISSILDDVGATALRLEVIEK